LRSTPKKVRSEGRNDSSGSPQVSSRQQFGTPNSKHSPRKDTAKTPEELDNGCSSLSSSSGRRNGDDTDDRRPKLKPLHWDKVRATSDRATVWDQLNSSSFQ